MIPKNIKREHIIKAIEEAEKARIPEARSSKKFLLEFNGKYYPPKYIISLANRHANGVELDSSEFSGGSETNDFLKALGFKIVRKPFPEKIAVKHPKGVESHRKTKHDERCPQCKETVRRLLEKIYGKVKANFKFEVGTYPEDFRNTSVFEKLLEIFGALQNLRGFKEFVGARSLPHCDFFIPSLGFVVEFDESQHFTLPRKITLEHYPELELGFDKERWLMLCEKIKAKDNNPPYRDEQRAWYDTLRDFLPAIKGLKPTVRLFASDLVWCDLNPNNPADIERFKSIMNEKCESWEIDVR
jgi:ribosomal protein L37AE/L43A